MLFLDKKHIEPEALALLRTLQKDQHLRDFFLVGGTALSMQIGHRLSIDLDFFTEKPFDSQQVLQHLSKYAFRASAILPNTLLGFAGSTKVDFIAHQYPLVSPLVDTEGFRMAAIEDIAAMKLNAIVHSGQRLKDFWDIYFLLEKMPLSAMLRHYEVKYPASNAMIALKAVTYFEDINPDFDKPRIWRKVSFAGLKKRIVEAVQQPDRLFL
jgi:predicted nucleotidyltransferase component of viral defense system